jgi:hypothetical protein
VASIHRLMGTSGNLISPGNSLIESRHGHKWEP